jgi:hypothetical protein
MCWLWPVQFLPTLRFDISRAPRNIDLIAEVDLSAQVFIL